MDEVFGRAQLSFQLYIYEDIRRLYGSVAHCHGVTVDYVIWYAKDKTAIKVQVSTISYIRSWLEEKVASLSQ